MATLITKNSSTASAVPAAGDLVKGELAVNVTDKKVYTKDNSAAVVKLVGSLGNQEANAVAITGGTINGTTIGATTPSTGAFTTASASSGFTGNLTGNVTGNVSGTAANVTGVVAIANGGTGLSALGTGVQSALGQAVTGSGSFVLSTSPSLTTPNLGTPSAAVLTNATGLPLTTGVTGTLGVANGGTGITAFGTGVATALGQNVTGSGGIVLATSPSLTTPNLGTPSAATLTNATGLPIATGVSGLGTGVATALAVNTGSSGAFVVNGGALGTPSSGTLTNATGLPLSTGVTGTLAVANGGTGQTTANAAFNALAPSQTGNSGKYLTTDGTNTSWATNPLGTVTSVAMTVPSFLSVSGSPITSSGTLAVSLSGTALPTANGGTGLTSFTANGVVYASSSSALTTGSALVFDGTNLGLGAAPVAVGSSPVLEIYSGANNGILKFTNSTTGTTNSDGTWLYQPAGSNNFIVQNQESAGDLRFYSTTQIWSNHNNSTEYMRLTSTGLGIGTSSPAYKLEVQTSTTSAGLWVQTGGTTSSHTIADFRTGSNLPAFATFGDGSSVWLGGGMTLNSSGNLGLGVTPSAWSLGKAFEVYGVGQGLFGYINGETHLLSNSVYNSGWKYAANGYATDYYQLNGQNVWRTAPSGTAGNAISFTQAMTLDASGNLLVGKTSSGGIGTQNFEIKNASSATMMVTGGSYDWSLLVSSSADALRFYQGSTERARITSGGDLLVGTTSSTYSAAGRGVIEVGGSSTAIAALKVNGSGAGYLYHDGTNLSNWNLINGALLFGTNNTERARITSGGSLLVGTTSGNFAGDVGIKFDPAGDGANLPRIGVVSSGTTDGASVNYSLYSTGASAFRFYVGLGGTVYATNTTISAISDIRFKENVQDLDVGLDAIMALKPRKFDWKEGKGKDIKDDRGFIAQEFEQVFPDLVDEWADPAPEGEAPYKSVRQDLIPVLVKAIQELKAQNDDLRARLAAAGI